MHNDTTIHKAEHTFLFIRVTDPAEQPIAKVMDMMDVLGVIIFGALAAIDESQIHNPLWPKHAYAQTWQKDVASLLIHGMWSAFNSKTGTTKTQLKKKKDCISIAPQPRKHICLKTM